MKAAKAGSDATAGGGSNAAPRRPGRPKSSNDLELRARLTAIAFRLFVEKGYEATTVSSIAADGHVSKRTVYRLYPGKTDLFAAAVAHHRGLMLSFSPPDPAVGVEVQLANLFRIDIDPETAQVREAFICRAIEAVRSEPALGPILETEGVRASRQGLADWLSEAARIGMLSIGDPLETAHLLMEIVFGAFALKTGQGAQWPGGSDRAAFLRRCLHLIATGLIIR